MKNGYLSGFFSRFERVIRFRQGSATIHYTPKPRRERNPLFFDLVSETPVLAVGDPYPRGGIFDITVTRVFAGDLGFGLFLPAFQENYSKNTNYI